MRLRVGFNVFTNNLNIVEKLNQQHICGKLYVANDCSYYCPKNKVEKEGAGDIERK